MHGGNTRFCSGLFTFHAQWAVTSRVIYGLQVLRWYSWRVTSIFTRLFRLRKLCGVVESIMGSRLAIVRFGEHAPTPPDPNLLLIRGTRLFCALSALVGGMMTVSLREAHSSKHRFSLAAVRSTLLLMLFALFGASSAFAQGLS